MIITCDNCQTRFKIPDEKVTEKGVKVRCVKCQNTFRVKRPPEAPAQAPAPPAPEADPFALFSAPPGGDPAPSPAAGYEVRREPSRSPFEAPAQPGALGAVFVAPTRKMSSAKIPPPGSAPGRAALEAVLPPLNSGTAAGPLDALGLNGADPLADVPGPPAASHDPFAAVPGLPPPIASSMPDPFADAVGAPAAGASSMPDLFADLTGSAPSPGAGTGLLDDVPPADSGSLAGQLGNSLDFGTAEPDAAAPASGLANRKDLFDMALPEAAPQAPLSDIAATPLGRVALVKVAASEANQAGSAAPAAEVPTPHKRRGLVRQVGGLALNITMAAALLVVTAAAGVAYLTEGRLDRTAFSPARLKALFTESRAVVARDVATGLYETRSGRPVLFVRGRVENRGTTPSKGKVRAEINDGETLIRAAEVFAGPVATPEDLYSVAGPSDADALNSRTASTAAEVAPGAAAGFLLVFYEYPPDLSAFRMKVTVEGEGGKQTATR